MRVRPYGRTRRDRALKPAAYPVDSRGRARPPWARQPRVGGDRQRSPSRHLSRPKCPSRREQWQLPGHESGNSTGELGRRYLSAEDPITRAWPIRWSKALRDLRDSCGDRGDTWRKRSWIRGAGPFETASILPGAMTCRRPPLVPPAVHPPWARAVVWYVGKRAPSRDRSRQRETRSCPDPDPSPSMVRPRSRVGTGGSVRIGGHCVVRGSAARSVPTFGRARHRVQPAPHHDLRGR